jgi:hypothetical protein
MTSTLTIWIPPWMRSGQPTAASTGTSPEAAPDHPGSGHRIIARYGPRVGLAQARIRRVAAVAGTRGLAGLAAGRATPGLRALTVAGGEGRGLIRSAAR